MIRYLFLKKKKNDEINTELNYVYGDCASSISTIKYWTVEFKSYRSSIYHECHAVQKVICQKWSIKSIE